MPRFDRNHSQAVVSRQQKWPEWWRDICCCNSAQQGIVVGLFLPGWEITRALGSGKSPHPSTARALDSMDHAIVQSHNNIALVLSFAQGFNYQWIDRVQLFQFIDFGSFVHPAANGCREEFFLGGNSRQTQEMAEQRPRFVPAFLLFGVRSVEPACQIPNKFIIGFVCLGVQSHLDLIQDTIIVEIRVQLFFQECQVTQGFSVFERSDLESPACLCHQSIGLSLDGAFLSVVLLVLMEFVVPFFLLNLVFLFVGLVCPMVLVFMGFFLLVEVNCRHTCVLGAPITVGKDFLFDGLFQQRHAVG
mmetsp:Transcript_2497/g.5274  ORF Transcript_2497/g.5274 Transcript_2497/m.5274 type:complete len:303 (-) Transcript_2497:620-1528(-)